MIRAMIGALICFSLFHARATAAPGKCINGDCRNGTGTFVYPDGSRYEGEWENGKENGFGVCHLADGERYRGEWRDGKRSGKGTCVFSDGKVYSGQWDDGKENGVGTLITYPHGHEYTVKMERGEMKSMRRKY